jgi:crotonobetainyl-CoA:carnitine CoA-transferase CaiB-like acyl-CoA transferase
VTGAGYPLEGLRVLDLSRVLAGPIAGRVFESLGADVIKVEPPEGDVTRLWGEVRHGLSGYYTQQNAGKRNVCIDLKLARGVELLLELAARADVVIENFRPGVLARLGLGWEQLSARNPRLVLLSISGYGQSGPASSRAAYAPIIHAETGIVARQHRGEGALPRDPVLSIADMNGGLHGVIGVLAALRLRERTGVGQHVDIALFDAMLFTDDYAHFALDQVPIRLGSGEVWEAPGGPIMIAGDFRHVWASLSRRLGLADPAPEGSELRDKIRLRREATAQWFRSFPDRAALVKELDRANLAWGDVRTTTDAYATEHARARGVAPELDDRGGGTRPVVRAPYRFSNAESGTRAGAAYRGEHNRAVLAEWLGMSAAEIGVLAEAAVLLSDLPSA